MPPTPDAVRKDQEEALKVSKIVHEALEAAVKSSPLTSISIIGTIIVERRHLTSNDAVDITATNVPLLLSEAKIGPVDYVTILRKAADQIETALSNLSN